MSVIREDLYLSHEFQTEMQVLDTSALPDEEEELAAEVSYLENLVSPTSLLFHPERRYEEDEEGNLRVVTLPRWGPAD